MSDNTFDALYESVRGLEAGSSVTFNGFPMLVESQTSTLTRYYGELRWVNQLDGKLQMDVTLRVNIKFESELTRLKAEVERLKAEPDALTAYLYADSLRRDDIKTLKAHIERLTKAGDAMASIIKYHPDANAFDAVPDIVKRWHAAKEGKQP